MRQYSLIFHCSHCLTVPSPPAALLYCCTAVLLYRRANVHSGMSAMFMPYDHKGHIPGALPPCCAVHAVLCILSCVRCACCAVVRCAVLGLVHVRTGGCGHTRCVCMRASWLQPAPPPPPQTPPPPPPPLLASRRGRRRPGLPVHPAPAQRADLRQEVRGRLRGQERRVSAEGPTSGRWVGAGGWGLALLLLLRRVLRCGCSEVACMQASVGSRGQRASKLVVRGAR